MAKKNTKPCDPYTEDQLQELGDHLAEVWEATGDAPDAITAEVEYHGTVVSSNGGIRTFTLDQLDAPQRDRIAGAAARASIRQGRYAQAQPLSSYDRKGWLARYRQLAGTAKGRTALREAGATPARRTVANWLAGKQEAGRANREAIARAYERVRTEPIRVALDLASEATRRAAETFDAEVARAYGDHGVRFRDIR